MKARVKKKRVRRPVNGADVRNTIAEFYDRLHKMQKEWGEIALSVRNSEVIMNGEAWRKSHNAMATEIAVLRSHVRNLEEKLERIQV